MTSIIRLTSGREFTINRDIETVSRMITEADKQEARWITFAGQMTISMRHIECVYADEEKPATSNIVQPLDPKDFEERQTKEILERLQEKQEEK